MISMNKKSLTSALCAILTSLVIQPVSAITINFYNDLAAFEAATSTTLIDFEGIVGDEELDFSTGSSRNVGGVTFSVSAGSVGVAGMSAALVGSPYDSALLFSLNGGTITADLTTAGSGFTAIGGFFGDINGVPTGYDPSITTMTLTGTTGVLDTRQLETANMGAGTSSNFFGWTVFGDTILSLSHGFGGGWEGIDDFRYGTAVPASAPATVWLLGSGLIGLIGFARFRAR